MVAWLPLLLREESDEKSLNLLPFMRNVAAAAVAAK
jgi:hypothetical protein